ncbi:hypothetical protein [Rhizomonospora bruguierae]|uniref:hypothetical protein n=1 Tax=Rhizomonospora bruguierae TaxID=1581705 RepID=UPI001BCA7A91|nr:hypothetical protein [Micromonospora sp. NBRC 107566]
MTGKDTPRRVRTAAALTWVMAPTGLLLVLAGLLELRWWSTPSASRLVALLASLKAEYGAAPPALLRGGREGAVELVVLGVVCAACATLAPLVARGRRWARTCVLAVGTGTFVLGLMGIGADSWALQDREGYYHTLAQSTAGAHIPTIKALFYADWYPWLEDIAQGAQVLASLAVIVALAVAAMWHTDYFVAKRATEAAPTAWDDALARIREQNSRERLGARQPE